jgi:hypothetical protein
MLHAFCLIFGAAACCLHQKTRREYSHHVSRWLMFFLFFFTLLATVLQCFALLSVKHVKIHSNIFSGKFVTFCYFMFMEENINTYTQHRQKNQQSDSRSRFQHIIS